MASRLYPQEAQIMQLWDAGASLEVIACNVGISKARVSSIVSAYDGAIDQRAHNAMMRRGSAFLLRRIQLSRKFPCKVRR